MKKAKQAPIRIYVRALIRGAEQHGFVWRLQCGADELVRDIAPSRESAERRAHAVRDAIAMGGL